MARPLPRALAFFVTVLAAAALAFPIWYTLQIYTGLGSLGRALAWAVMSVAIFGILTVVVSVVRAFIAPALANGRRRNGNL